MFISYFQRIFGKDPKEFSTIEEVDSFVEKKKGHKLKVECLYSDVVSARGSVFPLKNLNVDDIIDRALNK